MDSGFYAACAGLRAQTQALEVEAHNLANVNTAGFRGEKTTFQSTLALAHPRAPNAVNLATNNYAVLEGTHLDLSTGSLKSTGNALDVAIEGSGFFAVETAEGVRYTRNGSFQVSSAGELVTAAGDRVQGVQLVQGKSRKILVPAGEPTVSPDGTVSVNGAVAGQIRLVDFPAETALKTEGGSLLSAPAASERAAPGATLLPATLESSNVNPITEVVKLIGVQREAEMLGRAMSLFDSEFNHIAASELGKV